MTQQLPSPDDEIDLAELAAKLWRGKYIIGGVTLLSTSIAAAYAFTAEEEWTSRTLIDVPRLQEFGEYYLAQRQLNMLTADQIGQMLDVDGATLNNTDQSRTTISEVNTVAKQVLDETLRQINSPDVKRDFWAKTSYFSQLSQDRQGEGKRRQLEQLVQEGIKSTAPDGKKTLYYTIELTAKTPEDAQKLLVQYLQQINRKTWDALLADYSQSKKTLHQELEQQAKSIDNSVKARTQNQRDQLERAYQTAAKAGIKTFKGDNYAGLENSDLLFLLGTEALQARANVLRDAPLIYPQRYYQVASKLEQLNRLPQPKNLGFTFRYIETPSLPINRDKPKRSLILALGALAGLMLGSLIVLGRDAFTHLRDKLKA